MNETDFGSMTLAQLEALAERFGAAVKTIHEARALLGGVPRAHLAGAVGAVGLPGGSVQVASNSPTPDSPFPCAECGRIRPERPGEHVQTATCDRCGNRLPGGDMSSRVMNKPEQRRNGQVTAVVQPLSPEERAAKLALPAFGPDGLPLEEDA